VFKCKWMKGLRNAQNKNLENKSPYIQITKY
jgi:hypothetical protein